MGYRETFNSLYQQSLSESDQDAVNRLAKIQSIVAEINQGGVPELRVVPEMSSPSTFVLTFEPNPINGLDFGNCISITYQEPEISHADEILARLKGEKPTPSKGGFSIAMTSVYGTYDLDDPSDRDAFIHTLLCFGAAIKADSEKIANFQKRMGAPSVQP